MSLPLRVVLLVIFCAVALPSLGERSAPIDSLPIATELFRRANTMVRARAFTESYEVYQQALGIANRQGYDTLGFRLRVVLSNNMCRQGRYVESDNLLLQLILMGIRSSNRSLITEGYNYLALGCSLRGDLTRALEYYLVALSVNEHLSKDKHLFYLTLSNMAMVQLGLNDLPSAKQTIKRAMKFAPTRGDSLPIATCLVNAGNIYESSDRRQALDYLLLGIEMMPRSNMKLRIKALRSIVAIYTERQQFDSAQHYLSLALDVVSKRDYIRPIGEVLIKQAQLDAARGNTAAAKKAALTALQATISVQDIETARDCQKLLASLWAQSGNFQEAYFNYTEFKEMSDSLLNEKNIRQTAALESKYAYEKEHQQYKKERSERDTKIKTQRLAIFSLATITLLIVVLLVMFYRSSRLKKRLLQVEIDAQSYQLEEQQRQMATATLKLVQNAESDAHCIKTLEQVQEHTMPNGKQELHSLLTYYKRKSGYAHWEEFETLFLKVHPSFHNTLSARFADLSPNERKLCIFIKLNMSNKDITQITFQSEEALKKARLRLRKKLGLERETNLNAFINGL